MPSFAIEVPGDANPFSESQLIRTLTSAASSDFTQVQSGTKQLQQWEKSPGFYRHLQSAYLGHSLPFEVRYLAIIQLKNGIDKYWRATASNAISKGDKAAIRERLLPSALNELDDRLALQNALVTAKIARIDYPQPWPDALTSLIAALRSNLPPFQLTRVLLVLLHIVKELSTARLQRNRQNLMSATPEIVHVLSTLYASTVEAWQSLSGAEHEITSMHLSLIALKVLRRLLVSGYDRPNQDAEVSSFWALTQNHLGAFISLSHDAKGQSAVLLRKHMVQLAKLHHQMAAEHPAAFAMLPNSLELTRSYWGLIATYADTFSSTRAEFASSGRSNGNDNSDDNESRRSTEKLALKGLLIIRECVKMVHYPAQTFKYRSPEEKEEKKHATETIRRQLLSEDFVKQIMDTIVSKFFVFQGDDLTEWQEEPEDWEKRGEGSGEDWEFSIRPCSEKLFLDLAINYKEILAEPLLQVFRLVASVENEDVLFKDSVYCAIGLAAPVINTYLDFDAFVRNVLVTEVQKQLPGFAILRRRTAILLAQWISIRVADDNRPTVYWIFQHLLNKEDTLNDQVVRITAGRQFKNVCDAWEFDAQQFMPFAGTILTALMHLIGEVEASETKMALLNTISVAVERLGHHISPFAERIVALLPGLWDASGEEHLMKQAILTIFARLVNAMKANSLPLHSMVFPIIRGGVDPNSDTQIYLLDDAMDLWASILIQTPEPASDDLLRLVALLYPIFELGSENLRKALEIAESYVILAPNYMLSEAVRRQLFTALSDIFGSLKPDAAGLVCGLVQLTVRTAEQLGGEQAVAQTVSDLVRLDFMTTLFQALRSRWAAGNTTGPLKHDISVDVVVETDYFCLLSQIILSSLDTFCEACQHSGVTTETGSDLNSTMKWLLEEWFGHFENIGDPSRRKIICLALTRLLDTHQPWILLNLQSLMTIWTDVITELREVEEDTTNGSNNPTDIMGDSLVMLSSAQSSADTALDAPEAPEDTRRRHLTRSSAVHTINLPHFVKAKLQNCVAACGGEQAFQNEWLVNVDRDVLDAFLKLGIMA